MKYLNIDDQTISDLSIFGSVGKSSIYELFNKTVTQGGSSRLEKLFRSPLSDEHEINRRAGLYKFFSDSEYTFPVDSETIGALAYYMGNDDVRTQIQVGGQSFSQRIKDMVAVDGDQRFVHDGVQGAIRLWYKMQEFVKALDGRIAEGAYAAEFLALQGLIQDPHFEPVRRKASSKYEVKLDLLELSDLDKLVRFDQREKTFSLLEKLYELDVNIAVGQVARKKGFRFAQALPRESGILTYAKVYHPHVEQAIPNDLRLDKGHNVLFLTGANMAGKSTLMKSLGIALYLAHMGFPVAAERFEFSVRDGLFTSINLADNLNMGASHYYAEVLRVKEVAQALQDGRQLFVVFDELFRGTNVKDAYDATIALTEAFSHKLGSQFIVSTHIMEAGEVLMNKPLPIKFQFLPTEMKGNTPIYTRVLRDGITADRQGMVIIQNEGILEMLDAGLTAKIK